MWVHPLLCHFHSFVKCMITLSQFLCTGVRCFNWMIGQFNSLFFGAKFFFASVFKSAHFKDSKRPSTRPILPRFISFVSNVRKRTAWLTCRIYTLSNNLRWPYAILFNKFEKFRITKVPVVKWDVFHPILIRIFCHLAGFKLEWKKPVLKISLQKALCVARSRALIFVQHDLKYVRKFWSTPWRESGRERINN